MNRPRSKSARRTAPRVALALATALVTALPSGGVIPAESSAAPAVASAPTAPSAGSRDTWFVALRGAPTATIRAAIERTGARVVGWAPENSYLVRGTDEVARELRALPAVERVDRRGAERKIAAGIAERAVKRRASPDAPKDETFLTAEIFEGEDVAAVAQAARNAGLEVLRAWDTQRVRRLVVRDASASGDPALLTSAAARLADLAEIEWVEDLPFVQARNDTVRWVIQSNVPNETPLYENGLFGAGQIVGIIDGPIALNSCFFFDPLVPEPGPTHRKLVSYHSSTGYGQNGHGTHVAGIVAGDRESTAGTLLARGMAPKARIAFTNYFDVQGLNNSPSNLDALLTQHHAEGARVHTNSWGQDGRVDYVTWSRDIDVFTRAHEDDLVLFAVTNQANLAVPENAKNVLAVGASNRPGMQGSIGSGGSGPTNDGRRKPELFAPGIGTVSAAISSCATAVSSGTSMASPAVAGGALLVREYLMRGYFATGAPRPSSAVTPTGALVKAMLLNAGRDMTSVSGYPNDQEGWGRLLLDDVLYFAGDAERLWFRDVRHAAGLSTGESDEFTVRVVDAAPDLRITLVFTDQPATVGANPASVNDLDLEVEGPGGSFLGNVFATSIGYSISGGFDDPRNNVERVILDGPVPGDWTVRVVGESVPLGPQGYALVVNGGLFPGSRAEIAEPAGHGAGEPTARGEGIEAIELATPRPNPFASATSLRLALPAPAVVRLTVYDVRGRVVRSLADGAMQAGEHFLEWNGRTDDGRPAPSGIYFVRLISEGVDRRVKAVLLR